MAEEDLLLPGQVWSYKSRAEDPNSTLVIGLIENHSKLGKIIHIRIEDVRVESPQHDKGFVASIGHIPISEEALLSSLEKMLKVEDVPSSVEKGIETWREAQGGVFTVSVAEAVQFLEDTLSGRAARE